MTAAEKEPYNLRAKKGRNGAIKMTAANENLALVLKQEQDAKEQLLFMQDDIKRQIRFLSESNSMCLSLDFICLPTITINFQQPLLKSTSTSCM